MSYIREVHVHVDGCSRGNPGASAVAFTIHDRQGNELYAGGQCIGDVTNHVAEYMAFIKALEAVAGHCRDSVFCYSDSELVVKQLNGTYRIKAPHLLELFYELKKKEQAFKNVTYTHKPRTHKRIRRVDALANKILDDNGFDAPLN